MPFNPNMSQVDSLLLCDFLTECHLPETIEIVEGYDSVESVERSWSQGEIVYLHAMKELSQVIAQDGSGNHFTIPLNYPEKMFESIPNRCRDTYETVEELIVDFPKYVRSLRDLPQSGVKVGEILSLLETSTNTAGSMELKCRLVGEGTTRTISLSGDQIGPFETLEDANPTTMRDITDRHLLPTRVRVRAGRQDINYSNTNKRVMFEGLFVIEEKVHEKVLLAYTLVGKNLRVVQLPIHLEVRVRKKISKIDPKLLSDISRLIDHEVNIESTITSENEEDATWIFDIEKDIDQEQTYDDIDADIYEEIRPPVPPRSPTKPTRSNSNQYTALNNPEGDTRYVPSPMPKPIRKPASPEAHKESVIQAFRPPIAKKPSVSKRKSLEEEPQSPSSHPSIPPLVKKRSSGESQTNTSTESIESHVAPKTPEVTSNYNRPDEAGVDPESASHPKPKPARKPVVPKGSAKSANCNRSGEAGLVQTQAQERLKDMSVSEVSKCLTELRLNEYVERFIEESIDGNMLLELDTEMMQDLGISSALHRKKLMMFIQKGWIPKL